MSETPQEYVLDMQSLEPLGRLVLLDFETTNSPAGRRAVEVAAIRVENGRITAELDCLINPGCPIDPFSQSIHGISDRDVAKAGTFLHAWERLGSMMEGATMLAHNASFDSSVMRDEIRRFSLTPPEIEWWCTLRLARKIWAGQFESFGLSTLSKALRLKGTHAHRAAADTGLALALLCEQVSAARRQNLSVEEIRNHALHKSPVCWPFPRQRHCPECHQ